MMHLIFDNPRCRDVAVKYRLTRIVSPIVIISAVSHHNAGEFERRLRLIEEIILIHCCITYPVLWNSDLILGAPPAGQYLA